MVSPYLDRPLRSIAEAEAERHRRSSKGNDGAGNADRTGAIWRGRPAGRVLARLGKVMIRPIHTPITVFSEDDYG